LYLYLIYTSSFRCSQNLLGNLFGYKLGKIQTSYSTSFALVLNISAGVLFTNPLSNSCEFFSSELVQILLANCLVRENKKFSSSLIKVKQAVGERKDLEENL